MRPVGLRHVRAVADHPDLRMAGHRQIRLDDHPAGRVERHAQRLQQRRRADAGRPHDGRRDDALHRALVPPARPRRARRCATTRVSSRTSMPRLVIDRARGVAQRRRKAGQHRRAGLDDHDARARGVDGPETRGAACGGQISASVPASSTPVGPPPTMTNVSSSPARGRVGLALGPLERQQDAAPHRRWRRRASSGPARAAPTRGGRSRRGGHPAPGSSSRSRAAAPSARSSAPRRDRSTLRHVAQQHAHVARRAAESSGSARRSPRATARRRHLVQQRLKDVVVVAIDQRDPHRLAAQDLGGAQARRTRRRRSPRGGHGPGADIYRNGVEHLKWTAVPCKTAPSTSSHIVSTVCPARLPRLLQPRRHRAGRQGDDDRRLARQPGDGRLHLRQGPPVSRRASTARIACCIPAVRKGPKGHARFERVSWDQALDLIVDAASRDARRDGAARPSCPYSYGGSNGLLTQDTSDATLFRRLGASRLARTVCAAPTGAANQALYGKMPSVTYQDFPEAKLILLWGVNPSSSGIHLVPYIREAQKRGATLVVIDPLTTPLARHADIHLAVRPGTDLPVALAIHRYLFEQRLRRRGVPATRTRTAPTGCAKRRARGPSSAPPPRPASPPKRLQRVARPLRHHLAGARAVRLGPGAQPQRRQLVDGHPGAAGRGRQVRRARRRLHDEQHATRGRLERTWIRAQEPATRLVNMNHLGRALTEYRDPPVSSCSSSTTRTRRSRRPIRHAC